METKAKRNARLKAMRQKYGLGEFKKDKKTAVAKRKSHSMRSVSMGKRKRSSGRKRGLMGGLTSQKNIIGTLGGALLSKYVGVSPAVGAAVGSYAYGKQGIKGAAVAYFIAPTAMTIVEPLMSKVTTAANSGFGVSAFK